MRRIEGAAEHAEADESIPIELGIGRLLKRQLADTVLVLCSRSLLPFGRGHTLRGYQTSATQH